ncbi:MAG TPA: stress response translation initiation inhibitor YciH [Candidatus Aenigmarchaeota archaeon]|nr:stress response translation initiation inhibitor YciH [Candidatus Aenigmarchaeota archaeon]
MVCPKCGLPEELCVCQTIAKEAQTIRVEKIQKRYGKSMTIIRGVDTTKIDVRDLMKKLKSKLACGGTYKNGEIELQGDHRHRIKEILVKEGFPRELIEVS